MLIISHRGNISGPIPEVENNPKYIQKAIDKGFDVKIDVWILANLSIVASGNDKPEYILEPAFLLKNKDKLWFHCNNIEAIYALSNEGFRAFFHQNDDFTLTTNKKIWTFPGKQLTENSIAVLQGDISTSPYSLEILKKCYGVCTNYPQQLMEMFSK